MKKEIKEKIRKIIKEEVTKLVFDIITTEKQNWQKELLYQIPPNVETDPKSWQGFEKCRKAILKLLKEK